VGFGKSVITVGISETALAEVLVFEVAESVVEIELDR